MHESVRAVEVPAKGGKRNKGGKPQPQQQQKVAAAAVVAAKAPVAAVAATVDVAKAVRELKAGKVEYRVEKAGIVHVPIGKRSFGTEKLLENATTVLDSLLRAKPASAKGNYFRSIAVTTTMGAGVKIDPLTTRAAA